MHFIGALSLRLLALPPMCVIDPCLYPVSLHVPALTSVVGRTQLHGLRVRSKIINPGGRTKSQRSQKTSRRGNIWRRSPDLYLSFVRSLSLVPFASNLLT